MEPVIVINPGKFCVCDVRFKHKTCIGLTKTAPCFAMYLMFFFYCFFSVFFSGESKMDIRKKVWDYIESNNLANFPRPVYHKIPNFKVS